MNRKLGYPTLRDYARGKRAWLGRKLPVLKRGLFLARRARGATNRWRANQLAYRNYRNSKERGGTPRADGDLTGKKIAILVANGFEQVELTEPARALHQAGADTNIVSPGADKVRGWDGSNWATAFRVDVPLPDADPDGYDGLLLPGGVLNPDVVRRNRQALQFIRAFFDAGKPVAAICHGPQTLIDAGVVEGRTLTSYDSIRIDLENAGAYWVDREVVVDDGLITCRTPDDHPAFNRKMIEEFARDRRETRGTGT